MFVTLKGKISTSQYIYKEKINKYRETYYKETNTRQCLGKCDSVRDERNDPPVKVSRPKEAAGRQGNTEEGDRGATTEETDTQRGNTETERKEESDNERSDKSDSEGEHACGGSDTCSNDSNDVNVGGPRGGYAAMDDSSSRRNASQGVKWRKKTRMPRSETEEVIEVRDILDLPPSVKASLSAWGSRSSFHSFRVDSNNDRYAASTTVIRHCSLGFCIIFFASILSVIFFVVLFCLIFVLFRVCNIIFSIFVHPFLLFVPFHYFFIHFSCFSYFTSSFCNLSSPFFFFLSL